MRFAHLIVDEAIVYCLIETGMRRGAVCNLDLAEVDFDGRNVTVREKGGQSHRYKISKESAKAIRELPPGGARQRRRGLPPLSGALPTPRRSSTAPAA